MIYLATLVFPFIAIGCGIVSLYSVIRFIAEIQRDIRNQKRAPEKTVVVE
jgi:hypothetical protein